MLYYDVIVRYPSDCRRVNNYPNTNFIFALKLVDYYSKVTLGTHEQIELHIIRDSVSRKRLIFK